MSDNYRWPHVEMEAVFSFISDCRVTDESVNIDIGGFRFVVDGKCVSFDFDAESRNYKVKKLPDGKGYRNTVTYITGRGLFFNECQIAEYWIDEWKESGLTPENVTAEFLSRATEIDEFFVRLSDENDNDLKMSAFDIESIEFSDGINTYEVDRGNLAYLLEL